MTDFCTTTHPFLLFDEISVSGGSCKDITLNVPAIFLHHRMSFFNKNVCKYTNVAYQFLFERAAKFKSNKQMFIFILIESDIWSWSRYYYNTSEIVHKCKADVIIFWSIVNFYCRYVVIYENNRTVRLF